MNRWLIRMGSVSKWVICIAGWGTGEALFESILPDWNRLMVTPFDPNSVPDELMAWCAETGQSPDLIVGASMGVSIGLQCASRLGQVPVIGIGGNDGFSSDKIDLILTQIQRSPDGYLRPFWRASCGVAEDLGWISTAFKDAGWTVASLRRGLEYLRLPWLSTGISSRSGLSRVVLIHGEHDLISPYLPIQSMALSYDIPFVLLRRVGHLPFGPQSVSHLNSVVFHEIYD